MGWPLLDLAGIASLALLFIIPHGFVVLMQYNSEFGYSRKDVILIGGGILGLGYGMYYGLQVRHRHQKR